MAAVAGKMAETGPRHICKTGRHFPQSRAILAAGSASTADRDVVATRARTVWIDADDERREQVRRLLVDRYDVVLVADA